MATTPAANRQNTTPGQTDKPRNLASRELIALLVIGSSIAIIVAVCWAAISNADQKEVTATAKELLTIVLPVLATWVGAVIAFYFGRENFESAQAQARELVGSLPSAGSASPSVASVMRKLSDTTHVKGNQAGKLPMMMVKAHFTGKVTRLLVINDAKVAMYMIHESRIEEFENAGGKPTATLSDFIADQKSRKNLSFGPGNGFVVVAARTSVADAKHKLESARSCQDIVVTENGDANEPVLGWISNTRLGRVT